MPPILLAFTAGGLSVVNPCGFALMPAFLSLYVGADEEQLPSASSRVLQGLIVGGSVSAGMLAVFAVVGLPIIYGAVQLTQAIPWGGLAVGLILFGVGVLLLGGRTVSIGLHSPIALRQDRSIRTMALYGAGYGVASLGCTLPVFLATVGASLATGGPSGAVTVFAAYGGGMTLVIMALALTAALVRRGLERLLRRLVPHMQRVSGGLLVVTGAYLTYYWARVLFGPAATLADDPIVGLVERTVATIQRTAASGTGFAVMTWAFLIVAAGAVWSVWRHQRRARDG